MKHTTLEFRNRANASESSVINLIANSKLGPQNLNCLKIEQRHEQNRKEEEFNLMLLRRFIPQKLHFMSQIPTRIIQLTPTLNFDSVTEFVQSGHHLQLYPPYGISFMKNLKRISIGQIGWNYLKDVQID